MPVVNKKKPFLKAFIATGGNIVRAAEAVEIERSMHYRWLKSDPKYAARFHEAVEQASEVLECEAIRRAKDGWQEPVFYKGRPVTDKDGNRIGVRKFSDSLLMFLLRGMRPEKYRERQTIEHGGSLSLQLLDDLLDKTMAEKRALKDGKK